MSPPGSGTTRPASSIAESKGSIRERDRAKRDRTERHVDLLRVATGQPWSYLFLINDAAIGRQDIAWWSTQGRTLFRDLERHVENAPALGAHLLFGEQAQGR